MNLLILLLFSLLFGGIGGVLLCVGCAISQTTDKLLAKVWERILSTVYSCAVVLALFGGFVLFSTLPAFSTAPPATILGFFTIAIASLVLSFIGTTRLISNVERQEVALIKTNRSHGIALIKPDRGYQRAFENNGSSTNSSSGGGGKVVADDTKVTHIPVRHIPRLPQPVSITFEQPIPPDAQVTA